MSRSLQSSPTAPAAVTLQPGQWWRGLLRHRGVQAAVAAWALGYAVVLVLVDGALPFDRPTLARLPLATQIAAPTIGMAEILLLIAVVHWLTRNRPVPDIAARAPERSTAIREMGWLLAYAAAGQVVGWVLGPALGFNPFSFHLAGTLVGGHTEVTRVELLVWASYNLVVYAVVPYVWFRRRYTTTQLNLKSNDPRRDLGLILLMAGVETAFELAAFSHAIFSLPASQLAWGVPVTFAVYFAGTVLPTMILIYAILVPRYLKVTGSATTTVLLGGVTYAAMHLVEGWSNFTSPANTTLSLVFVMFTYFGPGMIKTVLTLRTGNAWVHAWGYHALAPHVVLDTPHVVGIIRGGG